MPQHGPTLPDDPHDPRTAQDHPRPARPTTMRTMARSRYCAPSSLRLTETALPVLRDDAVLVHVAAAGVDAGTWHLVTGKPYLMRLVGFGLRAPRTAVPGLAFAGRVVDVGSRVSRFAVGDLVMGSAPGAFAEYLVAPESAVARTPATLDPVHAAALPISAVTALQAVREARVGSGDSVLVVGAGGGVGHYAVQLAASTGAVVTGVCSAGKADLVRSLSAHETIDHRTSDVTASGRRWDVIIDTAGNRPLRRLRRALSPAGSLVVVGGENGGALLGGTQRVAWAAILDPFARQRLRGLVSRESVSDYAALAALVDEGSLMPHVERTFPLAEAAAAIEHVRSSAARGKVVLEI